VIQIKAAILDVVSLLEKINTTPGTWCEVIHLANVLSSRSVNKDNQKVFCFLSAGKANNAPSFSCFSPIS
jgi:hypothetical protein